MPSVTLMNMTEEGTGLFVQVNPQHIKLIRQTENGAEISFMDGTSIRINGDYGRITNHLKSVLGVPTA